VPVRNRLRQLRADESGFTLVEVLTSMTVGLVVLAAAFFLLESSVSVSRTIEQRNDTLQRGRRAMEGMTRLLRSQVCLNTTQPILAANDDQVVFLADLSASNKVAAHALGYDPTNHVIAENEYDVVEEDDGITLIGYPDDPVGPAKMHLTDVDAAKSGSATLPIFRYYTYQNDRTGNLVQLTTPLTAADAKRVVMVKIAFRAQPEDARPNDSVATTFRDDVFVRLADPGRYEDQTKPLGGPRCDI
jgi:prepilin-type N-terminal cleavage/methylation domain-containing protein